VKLGKNVAQIAAGATATCRKLAANHVTFCRIVAGQPLNTTSHSAALYCADQVRRGDHDRYLAALLAPPERRPALLALYAFNLELARAAEVTSEPMLAEIRLTWWREALAELYAGRPRPHMVMQALDETGLPDRAALAELELLIDVRIQDLAPERFASLDDLVRFAEDGAGTLARLALANLGPHEGTLEAAAGDVGTAWALVGLMRCLARNARARRLYLPCAALKHAGVTPEEVYAGRRAEALAPLVREVLDTALARIERARKRCPAPPRWSLPALLLAPLARAYACRLRHRGADPFAGEAGLGHFRPPLLLAWHNWLGRF
jgi:phytoene synthase